MKHLLIFSMLGLLLTGCASRPRPTPLTQPDVVAMVQAGMTDEDIMRQIDATDTVFRLNAQDVVALRDQGVSDRLITFMMDTYTRAAVSAERSASFYHGYGPYYYPYRGYWYRPYHRCR